jgi:hypothetical protein
MPAEMSRRRFVQATGAAVAAQSLIGLERPARAATETPGFALDFARPASAVRPKFRWWWPHGLVDPAEIRREVDRIADAGFGGAEIADVHHSVTQPMDPEGHGWGTPAWVAAVTAALSQASRRGITIDLTIGPAWPAAVPTVTPDSTAAMKELAHGAVTVRAGAVFDGPAPAPAVAPAEAAHDQRLLAVQAVRTDPANATRKEAGLDAASVTDLTAEVSGGRLTWTAPGDGDWLVIAYWLRGSAQQPEGGPHTDPPSYVVDHLSPAGTAAVAGFWEKRILNPALRKLICEAGGALFEDSIELETDATLWTPDLPAEFEKRTGYDLLPYLPALVKQNENTVYAFEAGLTARLRRDLSRVLSALINEHHFGALRTWAHSIGLELRAQPYGLETDAISSAAILDIPEGESLGFHNLDDYRCLAGGRDMGGRRILSNELGAYAGGAYNTAWDKVLKTLGGEYAAGVNQTVVHGFSYAEAPGAAWPGFAAFTPYNGSVGYAESWGPRQPTWRHIEDVAGYLGRTQAILQAGTPRIDVAYVWQSGYGKTGLGAQWFTSDGVPAGWTHQMLSPALLDLPSATVARGRLNPAGPAYKVFVLDGDALSGREHTLPARAAERLLAFARAGLPVIVVGDWSDAHVPGVAAAGEDDRVRALVAELLARPGVRAVADKTGIPAALAALGLRPDAEYAQSSTLLNARRTAGKVDYYYFCNGKHAENSKVAAVDHVVSLARTDRGAVPYVLDAWTGAAEPLALYEEDGDRVRVRITLQPGEATIVALAPGGGVHATSTEADGVRRDTGRLVVRATRAGTFATTLANGRTVRTAIADVPAPTTLSGWRLRVEDWRPGDSPTETTTVAHDVTLDALAAWPDIPELQDVSGIGRYSTTVRLDGVQGAYLDLGEVFDTARVTVNGRRLPPVDQVHPVVDVGPYLRPGLNTIEVEVATTLNNRLRVADPAVYGVASRQRYGLIGPVRLIPYGEAVIRT